uniref:uncharacterized protein LOC105353102 n=1 Tax=Fragaria vesca subsp. vesca TaxID=101020 RepID=UPI0005CA165D|nr:PREDICTED: uncharacterized protein LOC105353102 [Fragaria vesca subsp. vesca]
MEINANLQTYKSMFVLVRFYCGQYHGALYKVNLKEHGESGEASGDAGAESPPHVLVPVMKFFDKPLYPPKNCLFEGVRVSSKLYLMAKENPYYGEPITPTNSFVFDTDPDATSIHDFPPSKPLKPHGTIISAYGELYYFAHPTCFLRIPDHPSLERYNSATNSWKSLPSWPYETLPNPRMDVAGYAVCYGYILISMYNQKDHAVMAFHIGSQTWHRVKVAKSDYYPFLGRAVVVDGVIYSLSFFRGEVLAFPFWRDSDGTCCLDAPLPLYIRRTSNPPMLGPLTQSLVYLGGLDFCLVKTGENKYSPVHQYLCMTTFRILSEEGRTEIRTLYSSVFQVDLMGSHFFGVNFCFTSDCEDVEPEEDCCPTAPVTSKVETTIS